MRPFCQASFVLLVLASSALPAGEKIEDALDGVWLVKATTFDGKKIPDVDLKDRKMVIKKDAFELLLGENVVFKGTFKVDAAKNPKTLDVTATTADGMKLPAVLGIYKLEGDTLTVCGAKEGTPRPADFACKEGSKHELIVYERKK